MSKKIHNVARIVLGVVFPPYGVFAIVRANSLLNEKNNLKKDLDFYKRDNQNLRSLLEAKTNYIYKMDDQIEDLKKQLKAKTNSEK